MKSGDVYFDGASREIEWGVSAFSVIGYFKVRTVTSSIRPDSGVIDCVMIEVQTSDYIGEDDIVAGGGQIWAITKG